MKIISQSWEFPLVVLPCKQVDFFFFCVVIVAVVDRDFNGSGYFVFKVIFLWMLSQTLLTNTIRTKELN